jgi:hypothetical protein
VYTVGVLPSQCSLQILFSVESLSAQGVQNKPDQPPRPESRLPIE